MKIERDEGLDVGTAGRRKFWGAASASIKVRAGSVPELIEKQQIPSVAQPCELSSCR
jgi:hypothetical protein